MCLESTFPNNSTKQYLVVTPYNKQPNLGESYYTMKPEIFNDIFNTRN